MFVRPFAFSGVSSLRIYESFPGRMICCYCSLMLEPHHAKQRQALEVYKGSIASPWDEVMIALIQVTTNAMDSNYSDAYREQAHLVKCVHCLLCVSPLEPHAGLSHFFRFFVNQTAWVLPALDQALQHLRSLAYKV